MGWLEGRYFDRSVLLGYTLHSLRTGAVEGVLYQLYLRRVGWLVSGLGLLLCEETTAMRTWYIHKETGY